MYTDQVMGGKSQGSYAFEEAGGRHYITFRGEISLENRGGFIQVSLPLYEQSGSFDASQYKGLKIVVRGKGEPYFVHFKTTKTIFPWQFFKAEFIAPADWQEIRIPFEKFPARKHERYIF